MKNIDFFLLALVLIVQSVAAQVQQEDFKPEDMTTFMIQVPHRAEGNGLAVGNSTLSAYLFFENYYDGDMNVTIELDLPKGFVLHEPSVHSFSLQTEYDDWYRPVDFYIPADTPCGVYNITAKAVVDVEGKNILLYIQPRLKLLQKKKSKMKYQYLNL